MSLEISFSVFGIFDTCSRYLSVFLGAQLTRLPNGAPVDLLGRLETRLIDADGYEVNGRKSGACLGSRPLVSASRVLRSRAADILVMSVYRMPSPSWNVVYLDPDYFGEIPNRHGIIAAC